LFLFLEEPALLTILLAVSGLVGYFRGVGVMKVFEEFLSCLVLGLSNLLMVWAYLSRFIAFTS